MSLRRVGLTPYLARITETSGAGKLLRGGDPHATADQAVLGQVEQHAASVGGASLNPCADVGDLVDGAGEDDVDGVVVGWREAVVLDCAHSVSTVVWAGAAARGGGHSKEWRRLGCAAPPPLAALRPARGESAQACTTAVPA